MRAKKSLGQHFLTSRAAVRDIVRAADVSKNDTILEIGPGKGILTEALCASAKKVIAVEKDSHLVEYLKQKFHLEIASKRLILFQGDALACDYSTLFNIKNSRFKLVANIPYYITGDILRHFLSSSTQPSSMTLLVQKEVAERIARSKKESILSLSVKVYGTPRYVHTVPAKHFKPRPKIDSAILTITNISKDFFKTNKNSSAVSAEHDFFTLVHAGFAHKRKLLIRNLEKVSTKDAIKNAFLARDISLTARAEDVPLEKWKYLVRLTNV